MNRIHIAWADNGGLARVPLIVPEGQGGEPWVPKTVADETVQAMIGAVVEGVTRQAMAAYAAAVLEASDAETDDEAREIAASWFSHWMRLGHPSADETDPEIGPRARKMLADVDHALRSFPIRPDATAALARALKAERVKALEEAYLAGFKASGEGWNGEFPFEGEDPEKDAHWVERRDRFIAQHGAGKGGE